MDPGRRTDELVAGPERGDAGPGRGRLWWAAALVCGGIALAVLRPDLALHADRRPGPLPSSGPTGVPTDDTPLSIVAWDTRGDLASDGAFVSAAVSRVRKERPEIARVFFAGRLPDGGRLVLAGSDVYRCMVATAVHALVVEPGVVIRDAPVTEVTALTDPQQVLGWAGRGVSGHVYAVVLSRPGPVRFELSPNVRFAGDGSPRRIWTPGYTEDGVVVAVLGADVDPVVTVRATGPGVFPTPELVRVARSPDAAPPAPLRIRGLDDLGASRLQALVGQQGSSAFGAGVRALPRDAPDEVPWLLEPFSPEDPTFLLCPTGAGTLVYRRTGHPEQRLIVRDTGAGVEPGPAAPSAGGAEVTLLDPAGHRLLTTTLPQPGFDNPLASDLP